MRFLLLCILAIPVVQSAEQGPIDYKTITIFKSYPLDTCIVSDEPLDSMGGSMSFAHDGQEFSLCCKSCVKDFAKDPAAYHAKLAAAVAAQAAKPEKGGHQHHNH